MGAITDGSGRPPTAAVASASSMKYFSNPAGVLYDWYRSCEAMRANLLRDLAVLPPAIGKNIEAYPRTVTDVLDAGWQHRSRLRRAAIGHAVAFETWRSLSHEGLTDSEAARLIIGLISIADQP